MQGNPASRVPAPSTLNQGCRETEEQLRGGQEPQGESTCRRTDTQEQDVVLVPEPTLLTLSNIANTCYAAAVVQAARHLNLSQMLGSPDQGLQTNLHGTLQALLTTVVNGPPVNVINLVMALNMMLPSSAQFAVGRQQCALEFLEALLTSLSVDPGVFTEFKQVGHCLDCGFHATNPGFGFSGDSTILTIQLPPDDMDIDIEQTGLVLIENKLTLARYLLPIVFFC